MKKQELTDAEFISILFKEDELGAVITAHLYIEYHIDEILQILMPYYNEYQKDLKLSYDQKINLLCACGVKKSLRGMLSNLGKIRNSFAHNLNYTIDKEAINNLYNSLNEVAKSILISSHNKTRFQIEHIGVESFKKLDIRDQFRIIAVVIRDGVLALKDEFKKQIE